MHDDGGQVEARIRRFMLERLHPAVIRRQFRCGSRPGLFRANRSRSGRRSRPATPSSRWAAPGGRPGPPAGFGSPDRSRRNGRWTPGIGPSCCWTRVARHPGFQAEGLVYTPQGGIIKAIEPRNAYVPLDAEPGAAVELYLEAAANPDLLENFNFQPTPLGDPATAGRNPRYTFRRADIALRDVAAWELLQDFTVLEQLMLQLDPGQPRRARDPARAGTRPGRAGSCRHRRHRGGRPGRPGARARRPAHASSAHRISAVGHAHIDSAWLWPLRETMRKSARTFANVLALAGVDPEFVFACSQAQQYAWVQGAPAGGLRRGSGEQVAAGQFVPVGGMWVEADTQPARRRGAGPPVRARQAVLPRGVRRRDRGGLAARLVRLLRRAARSSPRPPASSWFLTQKLSWNETNTLPAPHLLVGGHRRHPDLHPLPAGRHLQRRPDRPPSWPTPCATSRTRARATRSLLPVRLRRRRRRPDPRDARRGRAGCATSRARRGSAIEARGEFFARRARPSTRTRRCGRASCTWSAPRHVHQPGPDQARATGAASTCCARPSCGRRPRPCAPGCAYPYDAAGPAWKTVLLHQFHDILPGSLDRLGAPRGARPPTPRVAAELAAHRRRRRRAAPGSATPAAAAPWPTPAPYAGGRRPALGAVGRDDRPGARRPASATDTASGDGLGAGQRPGPGRGRRRRPGLAHVLRPATPTARRSRRAPRATCSSSTPTSRPVGRLGHRRALPQHASPTSRGRAVEASPAETRTRSSGARSASPSVRSAPRRSSQTARAGAPAAARLDDRHRGRLARAGEAPQARLPARRARRPRRRRRSSSATSTGPRTPTPAGTRPGSRSAPTAGCTSGEPGYGVAAANDCTYGHDVSRGPQPTAVPRRPSVRLSLLRAPRFPDPRGRPGRHTFRHVAGARRRHRRTPSRAATGSTCLRAASTVWGRGPVAPLVRVDNAGGGRRGRQARRRPIGDVIVRLYEALGGRAKATISAGFGFAGVSARTCWSATWTGSGWSCRLSARSASSCGRSSC